MRIGLVGKPNVGKSTFFSASTLAQVDIANYPFCTIDPNVGVAFVEARQPCPCKDLRQRLEAEGRMEPVSTDDPRQGSLCEPRTGSCIGHRRRVPVAMVDVAGLVPGASEGKGRGNAFLADLANCDVLIQVVDAAGTTDLEGQFHGTGASLSEAQSGLKAEIEFLQHELDAWIGHLLTDGWSRGVRRVQAEGERGLLSYIHEKLSGLGANPHLVATGYQSFKNTVEPGPQPWEWDASILHRLGACMRAVLFPVAYAANKWDIAPEGSIPTSGNTPLHPCMADVELALKRADLAGLIRYEPGSPMFDVPNAEQLTEAQAKALRHMAERMESLKGTGLAPLMDHVLFSMLDRMVVYPVQDESRWVDGDGRVLPDAFVVPQQTQAKPLAYLVHSDLGDGFIRGVDGRTKRVVGAEHELNDGDVLKIHAKA